MDWGRFDSQWLDKKLKPNTFWVQESGDDPQNFERNFPKSEISYHIITDSDAQEYKKRGRDVIGGLILDTKSTIPNLIRAEFVAVTTRGKGGSEFLDTLTDHGQGTIGNKNNMVDEHTIPKQRIDGCTKIKMG